MNILYLISTFEKGIGGHYYSLQTTIEALSPEIIPIVVNIGKCESPIISKFSCEKIQIKYTYFNFIKIRKQILELIKEYKIDRLHCFDDRAYLFVRDNKFKHIPLVVTKCGGKNPKFYPKVKNLIVYSKENLDFFKKTNKSSNVHLVPNRVLPFESSNERILELRKRNNLIEGDIVFLRITRISNYYRNSLMQSINLVNDLNKSLQTEKKVKLIIIGQLIDEDLLGLINNIGNQNVIIETNKSSYTNAKELITICDFYVGTGRGVMEASSKKKSILTPVLNRKYPALITKNSFDSFFRTNFSERNSTELSDQEIFEEVAEAILSKDINIELSEFSYDMFVEKFSITSKRNWYFSFYDNLDLGINLSFGNRFLHFMFFHYYYISQR